MSKRITITIEDNIADADALQCVMQVADMGKISGDGKYYCYATLLKHSNYKEEIAVYTSPRVKGDNSAFTVMKANIKKQWQDENNRTD